MILYELVNNITKEGYVGITHREPKYRWREHLYELKAGTHGNPRLQSAYNKYGKEAFEFKIRNICSSLEELNKLEKEILENEKNRLYNLAPGGNAFYHYLESKQKISKSQIKPVVGMCIKTGEIRHYDSVTSVGKDGHNPKNIGGICKKSIYQGNSRSHAKLSSRGWVWMYEKDFTLEEMEKRRQLATRGKIRLERPVIGKSLLNGEIVRFISGAEAKRVLGISLVYRACQYDSNKSRGGYVWVYGDIDSPESLLESRWKSFTDNPPKTGPKMKQHLKNKGDS